MLKIKTKDSEVVDLSGMPVGKFGRVVKWNNSGSYVGDIVYRLNNSTLINLSKTTTHWDNVRSLTSKEYLKGGSHELLVEILPPGTVLEIE